MVGDLARFISVYHLSQGNLWAELDRFLHFETGRPALHRQYIR